MFKKPTEQEEFALLLNRVAEDAFEGNRRKALEEKVHLTLWTRDEAWIRSRLDWDGGPRMQIRQELFAFEDLPSDGKATYLAFARPVVRALIKIVNSDPEVETLTQVITLLKAQKQAIYLAWQRDSLLESFKEPFDKMSQWSKDMLARWLHRSVVMFCKYANGMEVPDVTAFQD